MHVSKEPQTLSLLTYSVIHYSFPSRLCTTFSHVFTTLICTSVRARRQQQIKMKMFSNKMLQVTTLKYETIIAVTSCRCGLV